VILGSQQEEHSLSEALADKFAVSFGGEENYNGTDFRPAAWSEPDVITHGMLAIADRELAKLSPLRRRASHKEIIEWLYLIAMVSAKKNEAPEDIQSKMDAYAGYLDDFPAGAFNARSRKAVVAKHKFFPVVHELVEILTVERDKLETKADRLDRILKTGERAGKLRPKWTKEDAEAHAAKLRAERDAERAALARAIAEQDAGLSVPGGKANKPSMRRLSVPSAADMRAAYAATKRTGDE
jgi:hypothetical protein